MSSSVNTKPQATPPPGDKPKIRQCLRCDTRFESEWSGERVCPRCKRSSSWRAGAESRPLP